MADLQNHIWDLGYKIIQKRLKMGNFLKVSTAKQLGIASDIFPAHGRVGWSVIEVAEQITPFRKKTR